MAVNYVIVTVHSLETQLLTVFLRSSGKTIKFWCNNFLEKKIPTSAEPIDTPDFFWFYTSEMAVQAERQQGNELIEEEDYGPQLVNKLEVL